VACGAFKTFDADSVEVKRMYTREEFRGKGIASMLLENLEIWAKEMGYSKAVLETGKRQPDAIRLYQNRGYQVIPNYGQYVGIENSVCFEKKL
jgi:GNAT superfamily N-acetyltransferase